MSFEKQASQVNKFGFTASLILRPTGLWLVIASQKVVHDA